MAERLPVDEPRWAAAAAALTWDRPPTEVAEPLDAEGGRMRWFPEGQLNLAVNAVHRHVPEHADRVALHWEGEPGDRREVTYGELDVEVLALADALAGLGVSAGDRVALHLGLIPEAIIAILACARLGAIHSILPAVLPPDALTDRLTDLAPRVLVTQDGAWRHGVVLPLKQRADEALTAAASVEHTVIVRRTGIPVPWYDGDHWYDQLVAAPRPGATVAQTPAVSVASDHPALITYLANRGGRPTGVVHSTGGLATYAAAFHRALAGPDDVLWAPAELGWMASQAHGILGPLLSGATSVAFEGMLDTPTHRRAWDIIERYEVATLLVTPSVVRALRSWVGNAPAAAQVRSLRRIVTAGEALDDASERWLRDTVGRGHTSVVNAWGQTELGGVVAIPPTASTVGQPPDAGLRVETPEGEPVPEGTVGDLVVRRPWPGTALGLHRGDGDIDPSLPAFRHGAIVTGDRARVRGDGTIELLGRSDRLFTVSGQLVSATEIRLALEEHPQVARAEVVDRADASTGRAVVAVVQPRAVDDGPPPAGDETLARDLRVHVRDLLGGLSQPRTVVFLDRFPSEGDDRLIPALRNVTGTGGVLQHLTLPQLEAALTTVAPSAAS